jgi:hypothetical protein
MSQLLAIYCRIVSAFSSLQFAMHLEVRHYRGLQFASLMVLVFGAGFYSVDTIAAKRFKAAE